MRPTFYVLLGVLLVPTVGLVGDIVTDGKFKSTKSSGAPLEVASDDMVLNFNADMVDGVEGTDLYTKGEVDALVSAAVENVRPRKFYLRTPGVDANQALTACGTGFHMASLWEIADPSNMEYAYERTDARTLNDSGHGPPITYGWVRTGWPSDGVNIVGMANCLAWTSVEAGSYGTIAKLPNVWSDPATGGWALVWGTPWATKTIECTATIWVWCVED